MPYDFPSFAFPPQSSIVHQKVPSCRRRSNVQLKEATDFEKKDCIQPRCSWNWACVGTSLGGFHEQNPLSNRHPPTVSQAVGTPTGSGLKSLWITTRKDFFLLDFYMKLCKIKTDIIFINLETSCLPFIEESNDVIFTIYLLQSHFEIFIAKLFFIFIS